MGAENRLHFFRMAAWGMFDPDELKDRRERKVRLKQIRHVFEDLGCTFHISIAGDSSGATYPHYMLYGPLVKQRSGVDYKPLLGSGRQVGPLCVKVLADVDNKFPPKDVHPHVQER